MSISELLKELLCFLFLHGLLGYKCIHRFMGGLSRFQWPRSLRRASAAARLLWNCGFESCRRHGCLSVVSVVCCQIEVFALGLSLVQRSPTEFGVSECDREFSTMRRPWPSGGLLAPGGGGNSN